jgi:hypothetical protein
MPKTPDANPLPGTKSKEAEVKAAMGPSASVKTLEHPDVKSAMAQLRECNVAHFACDDGVSDLLDPSKNGLILQTAGNATEKSRQDIASVREVSQA